MKKLTSWYKAILLVIPFLFSSMTPAYGANMNGPVQSQLNGLVTPKLINEIQKQQLFFMGEENIDPQTGSLSLKYTDLSLPGKNGLDLDITTMYNSSDAEMGRKYSTFQPYTYYTGYYADLGCYWLGMSYCGSIGPYPTYYEADQMAIWLRSVNAAYDFHSVQARVINTGYYLEIYDSSYFYHTWVGPYQTYAEADSIGTLLMSNAAYGAYIVQSYQKEAPTNQISPVSYSRKRYNLGSGWSFGFPSVEMYTENGVDYKYFHDGNGGAYQINLSGGTTHLVEYQSNNVAFNTDSATFSNGQMNSAYYFEDENKVKTYFGNDGRLLGMVNKLGDTIKFEHANVSIQGSSYPLISKITDSVGRTVNFAYADNPDGINSDITLTVVDPTDASNTVKYKYSKILDTVAGVKQPKLWKKALAYSTPEETTVSFDYDLSPVQFNYSEKRLNNQTTMTGLPAATIYVHNLTKVVSPLSSQNYAYGTVNRNLGSQGMIAAYRISGRYDKFYKAGGSESGPKNEVNYLYSGDYTGYGSYNSSELMQPSYQYWSEATRADGKKIKYTYNGSGQQLSVQTTATNQEKQLVANQTFDTSFRYKPTKTEFSEINASNAANRLYMAREYYNWGGLKSESTPLPLTDFNTSATLALNTTNYTYDSVHRKIASVSRYQNATQLLTDSFTYDANGRLLTATNANNETTTHAYLTTAGGELETVTTPLDNGNTAKTEILKGTGSFKAYPTEIRSYYTDDNGVEQISKQYLTYDMLHGQVATDQDHELNTTVYEYDKLGRSKRVIRPEVDQSGDTYTLEESFSYTFLTDEGSFDTSNANLSHYKIQSETVVKKNGAAPRSYNKQVLRFDGFGNGLTQEFYDTDRNQWITQYQLHYDEYGRAVYGKDAEGNTSEASYDPWDRPYEMRDAFGNLYRSDYDILARKQTSYFVAEDNVSDFKTLPQDTHKQNVMESVLDDKGQLASRKAFPKWPNKVAGVVNESFSYDLAGNIVSYLNPRGLETDSAFDKLNRLHSVEDALGQVTEYDYSVTGQLKSVTQSDGTNEWVTTKQYDETGILVGETKPDATSGDHFIRNKLGQVVERTDPNGNNFAYDFDEWGRNTGVTIGTLEQNSIFTYSPFGPDRIEEYNSSVLNHSVSLTYYATGNLKDKTVINDGFTDTVDYFYDKNNRLTGLENPFGDHTRYTYDKTRFDKVQTNGSAIFNDSDDTQFAKYSYYPNGTLQSVTYPELGNGQIVKTEYAYDDLNRLLEVLNTKNGSRISEFTYEYDANGNRTAVIENDERTEYVYDKLDRLLEVYPDGGSVTIYSYDARGNRQTIEGELPEMDDEAVGYAYNVLNQLVSVTKDDETTVFSYDPDTGLRNKKTSDNMTRYSYNGNGQVIAESDDLNDVIAHYVWGPDRLLVKRDVSGVMERNYLYLYNGHGDVVQMIDQETGETVNEYSYDEWGNIASQEEGVGNVFKYAGEPLDEETGLYYLRARYYDPSIGRFINEDTYEGQINNPLTLNLYTYVYNNPLIFTDPTGHCGFNSWGDFGNCFDVTEVFTKENFERSYDYVSGKMYSDAVYWGGALWSFGEAALEYAGPGTGVRATGSYLVRNGNQVWTWTSNGFVRASKSVESYIIALTKQGLAYKGVRNRAADFVNGTKLTKHAEKHMIEFGYKTEEQYLAGARNFLEKKPTSTTLSFTSKAGTYFRYDTATNEFGIINEYGGVSTYMKPKEGIAYWEQQFSLYANQ